jgi:ribonucleoside-diphosphate reductase alpha chain
VIPLRRLQRLRAAARDALLTDFGKETLDDRYLLPGETYQDLFARVADAYADDQDHAQRLYDYISKLWFMPATPVLSNGGTGRGLPISCFLNSVDDSLEGIVNTWNENVWLASRGGGIGTYWGKVRGIGEPVGLNGKTSGIIPFVRVMDSLTLAIAGLAAARLGRLLSRCLPPGDRGIPRNPQSLRAISTARR